jgi:nitrite reductase/ring-hydroxylating ferredoxin subunit
MEMSELNRREFVIAAACAAGACMLCGVAGTAEAADAPAAGSATIVDAGPLTDYAKDGTYDKLAASKKVLLVRDGGKMYAMSAICTHKMGIVKLNGGTLECPKHHSKFANDGKVSKGPATAALFRHGISKNDDGHIIVDTSKKFGEKEWDKEGASLSVA